MALVRRTAEEVEDVAEPAHHDVEWLARRLHDADPEIRRQAAIDLHGHPETGAALVAAVAVEDEPTVRDALLTTLAGFDSAEVAAELVLLLKQEDASLRTAVGDCLVAMPDCAPVVLPGLLADPDPDVRIRAVMVVKELPTSDPLSRRLEELASFDEVENVVAAAVEALYELDAVGLLPTAELAARRFPANPYLQHLESAVRAQQSEPVR